MFGTNEVVGQKHFKDANTKLMVTSIFYTLQGEGPYAGRPAVFVRLSKCNLKCSFCDTWFDSGEWYEPVEVLAIINERVGRAFPKAVGIVLTGGEPMLQANIVPLLQTLNKWMAWTQIESNGLVYQSIPFETTLVVSPKCTDAGHYLEPPDRVMDRVDCLKFVMSAEPQSPYNIVPKWAFDWHDATKKPIYVSPMNCYLKPPIKSGGDLNMRSKVDEVISFWTPGLLDMKQNQANHEHAARYALENGLFLTLQLHLYASLA